MVTSAIREDKTEASDRKAWVGVAVVILERMVKEDFSEEVTLSHEADSSLIDTGAKHCRLRGALLSSARHPRAQCRTEEAWPRRGPRGHHTDPFVPLFFARILTKMSTMFPQRSCHRAIVTL